MSKWGRKLGKHRFLLILIGLAIVAGASLPPFMTASCLTRQQTPEQRALDNLRNMTRGDVLPSEDVVARIESDFPRSKAGALAREEGKAGAPRYAEGPRLDRAMARRALLPFAGSRGQVRERSGS